MHDKGHQVRQRTLPEDRSTLRSPPCTHEIGAYLAGAPRQGNRNTMVHQYLLSQAPRSSPPSVLATMVLLHGCASPRPSVVAPLCESLTTTMPQTSGCRPKPVSAPSAPPGPPSTPSRCGSIRPGCACSCRAQATRNTRTPLPLPPRISGSWSAACRPPRHYPGLGEPDALRRRRGGRPAPRHHRSCRPGAGAAGHPRRAAGAGMHRPCAGWTYLWLGATCSCS